MTIYKNYSMNRLIDRQRAAQREIRRIEHKQAGRAYWKQSELSAARKRLQLIEAEIRCRNQQMPLL